MAAKDWEILFFGAFIVSWLPIFPDPYYHVEQVSLWVWVQRELFELMYGEKAKAMLGL